MKSALEVDRVRSHPQEARAHRRALTDGQWAELARELLRPWKGRRDQHVLPDLVGLFRHDKAFVRLLDVLLAMRKTETVAHGVTATTSVLKVAAPSGHHRCLETYMTRIAPLVWILALACTTSWSQTADSPSIRASFVDLFGPMEAVPVSLAIVVDPDVDPGLLEATCGNLVYELRVLSDVAIDDVTIQVGNLGDGEGDTLEESVDLRPTLPHRVLLETDRFLTVAGQCEAQPIVVLRTLAPLDAILTFQVIASTEGLEPGLVPGDDAVLSVSIQD